jgi:hypothetical protein
MHRLPALLRTSGAVQLRKLPPESSDNFSKLLSRKHHQQQWGKPHNEQQLFRGSMYFPGIKVRNLDSRRRGVFLRSPAMLLLRRSGDVTTGR